MKERPILFSGPMVRAILDGRKTQTRRVVKPQPPAWEWTRVKEYADARGLTQRVGEEDYWIGPCPYGQYGDRLWVKETWADHCAADASCAIHYRAGGCRAMLLADSGAGDPVGIGRELPENPIRPHKWKPSIFMPRWASRITLEITAVRVERLQAISEADAVAEGYRFAPDRCPDEFDPIAWYESLWTDINGPDSWASNPYVWVIEFRTVKSEGSPPVSP